MLFVLFILVGRLAEYHAETSAGAKGASKGSKGKKIDRPSGYEPPVQASV